MDISAKSIQAAHATPPCGLSALSADDCSTCYGSDDENSVAKHRCLSERIRNGLFPMIGGMPKNSVLEKDYDPA